MNKPKLHHLIISTLCFNMLPVQAQTPDIPLGPIGGTCELLPGTGLIHVKSLIANAPGARANLQIGDLINGAYGFAFEPTSSDKKTGYLGALQELAIAIDLAEGSDGVLPLTVIRSGTGSVNIDIQLGTPGTLGPIWPAGSDKATGNYNRGVQDIHEIVMNRANADWGYKSSWFGMILLSHPDWNSTTGERPYRQSINKLAASAKSYLEGRILEPVEKYFWDGSAMVENPAYENVNLENWEVTTKAMFLAIYRAKSGDESHNAVLQRSAELIGNRIQHWKQYNDPDTGRGDPSLGGGIGRMGHKGVHGDYSHYPNSWGGAGALNIINAHALPALGLLKIAGADMSRVIGTNANAFGYNPGLQRLTIEEKFRTCWNYVKQGTKIGGGEDGNVGYIGPQGGYDSAGRTPGSFAGWHLYGMTANADDTDKQQKMANYFVRKWHRQQHAHAYTLGGVALSQIAIPFLDDRSERYFQENSRLFAILSRNPDGSLAYIPGRDNNGGDGYGALTYAHVGIINAAIPMAMNSGTLPGFPGPSANEIYVSMKNPGSLWPSLGKRKTRLKGLENTLQVEILNAGGDVLPNGAYTASWQHVGGPATVGFTNANRATTNISVPQLGTYDVRLTVSRNGYTLEEPWQLVVESSEEITGNEPSITNQPGDQSVELGESATFDMSASGSGPLLYQWLFEGAPIAIPSTSAQLVLENASAGIAGSYQCVITNTFGSATSQEVNLVVSGVGHYEEGGLWRDVFTGINGSDIPSLTSSADFPRNPSASGAISSAESPSDYGDNYGQRWSGWISPPETGPYRFYVASDDHSELWLSTTDKRSGKVLIAAKRGWTTPRKWDSAGTSNPVTLVAGNIYYIELLHKEGGGGDNAAFTWNWRSPGNWNTPPNGSDPLPGAVLTHQVGGTFRDDTSPINPLQTDDRELATAQTWTVEEGTTLTYSGTLSGNGDLTKAGPGTLILTEVGPRTGNTIVSEGTLRLDGGGWYKGYVGGSGSLVILDGATAVNVKVHAFGSGADPSRGIVINRGRLLIQRSTYVGDVFMLAGTISNTEGSSEDFRTRIGEGGSKITAAVADAPSIINAPLNFRGDATLEVRDAPWDDDLIINGALSRNRAGKVTKTGDGTLLLNSAGSNYSGDFIIDAGTLTVDGNLGDQAQVIVSANEGSTLNGNGAMTGTVSNNGLVSPGKTGPGILSIGQYSQSASGILQVNIGGTIRGETFDQLLVTSDTSLSGSLSVALIQDFSPVAGESFQVLSSSTLTGTFSSTSLPDLPTGLSWSVNYQDGVTLEVNGPDVDTDGDGILDIHETGTGIFISATNTGTNPRVTDTDGDGWLDGDELTLGTSPLDGSDALPFELSAAITMQGAGRVDQFTLSFPASSTAVYSIEASADFKTWVTLEADIAGTGNIIERSYPAIGALQRFGYFRVRRE
jgi:autotransporter-associated beta strand protein